MVEVENGEAQEKCRCPASAAAAVLTAGAAGAALLILC